MKRSVIAILVASMALAAMVGGVSQAAAKKTNRAVIVPKTTVTTSVAPNYGSVGYSVNTYSTYGAIR